MSYITANEIQLLTFFEVEPSLLDPNDPWVYNDATYVIQRGDFSLSFSLQPSYKDLRIIFKHLDSILYELNSTNILNVTHHVDLKKESLHIEISDSQDIWLTVKPEIQLRHGCHNPA